MSHAQEIHSLLDLMVATHLNDLVAADARIDELRGLVASLRAQLDAAVARCAATLATSETP